METWHYFEGMRREGTRHITVQIPISEKNDDGGHVMNADGHAMSDGDQNDDAGCYYAALVPSGTDEKSGHYDVAEMVDRCEKEMS